MVEATDPEQGLSVTVPAPIGFPPVFYRHGSVHGEQLREFLLEQGYTEGYTWSYSSSSSSSSSSSTTSGNISGTSSSTAVDGKDEDKLDHSDSLPVYVIAIAVVLLLPLCTVTLYCIRTYHNKQQLYTPSTVKNHYSHDDIRENLLSTHSEAL